MAVIFLLSFFIGVTMPDQVCEATEEEINLLDLLLVLARRWRMIAGVAVFAACASGVVVMLLPHKYQASAKVIAFQRQIIQPINATFLGGKPIAGALQPPMQVVNLPVLQEILQSTSLRQALRKQITFGTATKLNIKTVKSGAVEISVVDTDPQRAAAIANAAVGELGRAAYAVNLVSSPEITGERDIEKLAGDVTVAIKLLERAVAPQYENKPSRSLIVAFATTSALFGAVLLAFLLEWLRNLQFNNRKRWDEIKATLKR